MTTLSIAFLKALHLAVNLPVRPTSLATQPGGGLGGPRSRLVIAKPGLARAISDRNRPIRLQSAVSHAIAILELIQIPPSDNGTIIIFAHTGEEWRRRTFAIKGERYVVEHDHFDICRCR